MLQRIIQGLLTVFQKIPVVQRGKDEAAADGIDQFISVRHGFQNEVDPEILFECLMIGAQRKFRIIVLVREDQVGFHALSLLFSCSAVRP